jgi:type VI secretion system protein ImpA
VADHAAASAALLVAEQYFARTEPSSPSLILVHQARTLVGQPLVVALDTLLPEMADRALISVDNRAGLQLAMSRMRSLTADATNGATPSPERAPAPDYAAQTRQEAESLIHGVEAFFHRTEPSSPIPMLLAKARTFMNRDFSAILADIVKNNPQELSS